MITGKAIIRADGLTLATENGAKLNVGGIKRTGERHGNKRYAREEEVNPTIDCTILHDEKADAITLSKITDATIEFECNTGQIYIMRGSDVVDPGEVDTGTGKMPLKFEGDTVDLV